MKNRNLLMIPGPIEFDPAVMAAMGAPTTGHLAPNFIEAFGQALERMRDVFACPDGQPFALAGTGTLAMDTAAANLVEPGDRVLVVNTGYFGDRFAAILERYGAQVTQLRAQPGCRPEEGELTAALQAQPYKLVTVTHVDTSTGVLADVALTARLCREYGALCVVDGVCSVAGEELPMSAWGVDLALTASQKAVGVPPGLALVMAGPRAMHAFHTRRHPVGSYYADWSNWLPVMEAYEARKPSYFATPAVNLLFALDVSLGQVLQEGMEARIARHRAISEACRQGLQQLGLAQVPARAEWAAHTMSAPRLPQGVSLPDFLVRVGRQGVTLAGGLLPSMRNEYFRIGHMGAVTFADVYAVLGAIEQALR